MPQPSEQIKSTDNQIALLRVKQRKLNEEKEKITKQIQQLRLEKVMSMLDEALTDSLEESAKFLLKNYQVDDDGKVGKQIYRDYEWPLEIKKNYYWAIEYLLPSHCIFESRINSERFEIVSR